MIGALPLVEVTLTGTASAGAGFFDPGPGFARRPLAAVTGCAGVTVSELTVTSPTTARLALDTSAAAAGSCGVSFTNPDGQVTSAERLLTINGRPVANADAFQTTLGQTLTGQVLANDSDPEADPLVAIADGAPASGELSLRPDGSFTFVPAAAGTVSFSYRVSDGHSPSAPVSATIAVAPRPVAPAPTPAPKISTPPPAGRCVVPKLKRLTLTKARAKLRKAGCRTGRVTRVRSRTVRRGRVVSSSPRAGKRLALGAKVKLELAKR